MTILKTTTTLRLAHNWCKWTLIGIYVKASIWLNNIGRQARGCTA